MMKVLVKVLVKVFDEGQSRTLDAVMVKLRDRGIDEGMCEAVAREVLELGKDVKNGRSE